MALATGLDPAPGEGSSSRRGYLEGARAVSALAVAIAAFGISFGVLARSAGMSPWAAMAMSATTLAGSAQFAAISVLAAGGGAVVAVIAGALLNARYAVMGISAAPALAGPTWSRFLLAQLVVDESWAVAHRTDGTIHRERLIGAGLVLRHPRKLDGRRRLRARRAGGSLDPGTRCGVSRDVPRPAPATPRPAGGRDGSPAWERPWPWP